MKFNAQSMISESLRYISANEVFIRMQQLEPCGGGGALTDVGYTACAARPGLGL